LKLDFLHFRGFEQLSSSIGWQDMTGKVQADISVSP